MESPPSKLLPDAGPLPGRESPQPKGAETDSGADPGVQALRARIQDCSRRELVALVLSDQAEPWRRGQRILVETYLQELPGLQANVEGVLDLIYSEVVLRLRDGETPQLEEYVE